MGINTDLNIDPYFDDFDKTKQFNRVLFRPARAVQARELTQLQTILQNQVERFGQNIYKEGTIVSGVTINDRPDIYYVKITDAGIADPSLYSQTWTADGEERNYTLEGQETKLTARIILGENGFETRDPNLKTFYIVYVNTQTIGGNETKQFAAGESLKLYDPDGNEVANAPITVSTTNNPVGNSYGLAITEGVVFQKGHFLFVEEQFVVVSKYDQTPDDVSVGFNVQESIVEYGEDSSLLDNAQGFNNANAPGADRLRLQPLLTVVASNAEPEEFYALARFEAGQQIAIRDVTEFNVVGEAMARRTYEESGNYTIRGLDVTLEAAGLDSDGNAETYAVVSPGKAYAFGYEVINMSPTKLRLPYESETYTKVNQSISASYGQYFEVDMDHEDTLNAFNLGNSQLQLFASNGTTQIGSCFIRSVAPGKVYVFAVEKLAGQETSPVWFINDTPVKLVSGAPKPIQGTRNTALIFNGGNPDTKAITNIGYTKRMKIALSGGIGVTLNSVSNTVTISNTAAYTPVNVDSIVLVTNNDEVVENLGLNDINGQGDITIDYSDANGIANPSHVYFDALFSGTVPDTIQQMDVYVKTVVSASTGFANLGLPNAVKILSITNQGEDGTGTADVTGDFNLVPGVKDGYYDKSGMQLKPGATSPAASDTLLVKMTVFRRISNSGNGYLDASSYADVDRNLIRNFSSNEGKNYNLLASVDFRPYVNFQGSYALSPQGAENVGSRTAVSFPAFLPITDGSLISGDIEYYLPRFDAVTIDSLGQFAIVKGEGSENPAYPDLRDVFTLATIYVPGVITAVSGNNALRVKSKSTRNYTMKDIARIDQQVDRLTDAVTLSLLEASTRSLVITGADGLDRFKNGILVDSFKNAEIANVTDSAYKAAIDKSYRVTTPSVTQFPIDLDVDSSSSTNVTNWADVTLIADDGNPVKMIDQPYGTNFRNAVSNFYNYKGKMQLYPEFDSGYDVIQNPAINIEIDIATPILDLVDNLQEFIPLTRTSSSTATGVTRVDVAGGTNVVTSSSTTHIRNSLTSQVTEATQAVGNFVTDIEFKPFLERRLVRIFVTGLRPGARHHVFFDEENVDTLTRPAVVISNDTMRNDAIGARQVYPVGDIAQDVYSDQNGIFACFFEIPANRFYVGEHEIKVADVDQYSSITSGGTSRAKGVYRGYNFDVGKTELSVTTRTPSFDVDETVTTTHNTTSRFIPNPDEGDGAGASCFVAGTIVSLADGAKKKIEEVEIGEKLIGQEGSINTVLEFDHPQLGGRDLVGINESGPFCTPEHPVFTKDGWKAPRMSDTIVAYPHLESIMVGDLAVGDEILTEQGDYVTVETIEWHTDEEEQQVFNFILDGNNTYFADGLLVHNRDPLSQTFFVKKGMAQGANSVFVRDVDLFFKARTDNDTTMADITFNGVTVEMREVINGYPSEAILPFGKKHLKPSEVNVSQDASVSTTVVFDNPLRLNIEKEYAIVIAPDALDPNYLVFTSKVGETDLVSGQAITNDWGDGVLFTSTNNKAWKSYQDEDVKFKLNRLQFASNSGSLDMVPKRMEFFTIAGLQGAFKNDELVYSVKSSTAYNVSWTPYNALKGVQPAPTGYTDNELVAQTITLPETSINFGLDDYCLITQGTRKHLAKVLSISLENNTTTLVLDTPPSASLDPASTVQASVQVVVAGKVSYYNRRKSTILHVKESSASEIYFFTANDILLSSETTAQATITSVDDIPVSYFQPMIYQSNTIRTATEFKLKNNDQAGTFRSIPSTDATYLTNAKKVINSLSNIKDTTNTNVTSQAFVIKVDMSNNGYKTASPIIDDDLSRVNAYQYQITEDPDTSSAYVSRKVILEEGIDAIGLKVILAAYRPPGTMVDVYGKFTYDTDSDADSGWIQLDQDPNSVTLYSSASNIKDYRDIEYNLDETAYTTEYSSFQVRIVMRHATSAELTTQGLTISPSELDIHMFAHVFDYRAIALT